MDMIEEGEAMTDDTEFSAFHYAIAKMAYCFDMQQHVPSPTLRVAALALYLQHKDDENFDFKKIDEHLYKYDLADIPRDMRDYYDRRPYHDYVEKLVMYLRDDSQVPLTVLRAITVDGQCKEWNRDVPADPKDFAAFLLYPTRRTEYEENRFQNVVSSYIERDGRIDGVRMSHHAYGAVDGTVGYADGDRSAFHYFALMAFLSKNKAHSLPITLRDVQWSAEAQDKLGEYYTRIHKRMRRDKMLGYGATALLTGSLVFALFRGCADDVTEAQNAAPETEKEHIEYVAPSVPNDTAAIEQDEKTHVLYPAGNVQPVLKP